MDPNATQPTPVGSSPTVSPTATRPPADPVAPAPPPDLTYDPVVPTPVTPPADPAALAEIASRLRGIESLLARQQLQLKRAFEFMERRVGAVDESRDLTEFVKRNPL